ncbi:UDP-4-amino-4,6-dideoxy-N-acetyl-beta-L-altrosamine N-acetyltransferase [bacterium]|nr:MAG: UDP-4-amino-4,6-dideoxy-N-acetyl-beta-L-altrosamine N-acetyltransferase [bacterium]
MARADAYRLRPLTRADLDLVLTWRNAPHIRRWMYTDHLISRVEHVTWFERVQTMESALLLLFECADEPLGVVNFVDIQAGRESGSWGFYLAAAEPPRGLGSKLGVLALAYAFERIGLRKLRAEVLASNARSLAFHHKLGFQDEATLPRHAHKGSCFEDVKVLGLGRERWLESKVRLERSAFGGEAP